MACLYCVVSCCWANKDEACNYEWEQKKYNIEKVASEKYEYRHPIWTRFRSILLRFLLCLFNCSNMTMRKQTPTANLVRKLICHSTNDDEKYRHHREWLIKLRLENRGKWRLEKEYIFNTYCHSKRCRSASTADLRRSIYMAFEAEEKTEACKFMRRNSIVSMESLIQRRE